MPPTPTAEVRAVRRLREQVAAALAHVADLQRRHEKLPRPKPERELLARLTERERVVVRTVAAAEVAAHTYGPNHPNTAQWNQLIENNQAVFEQTVRERDRFRDAAAREAEALAGAAVAIAIGTAFWEQPRPEPADIAREVAELDTATPTPGSSIADTTDTPAAVGAEPAPRPVAETALMWDELPPELCEDLAAAMQSHPHSLTDMLNHTPDPADKAAQGIDPQMASEYGIDNGTGAGL